MASLQEQFLKAGLVNKNKVKQANQEKAKQKKVERPEPVFVPVIEIVCRIVYVAFYFRRQHAVGKHILRNRLIDV